MKNNYTKACTKTLTIAYEKLACTFIEILLKYKYYFRKLRFKCQTTNTSLLDKHMLFRKLFAEDKGSTTVNTAYILIIAVMLFSAILALSFFFSQTHNLSNKTNLLAINSAENYLNNNMDCKSSVDLALEYLVKQTGKNKKKITMRVNNYFCTEESVQIQTVGTAYFFKIPFEIKSVARAGFKDESSQ